MNTEEKAKAYDEALDKAKKELQTCGSTDCDAARQIFRFFHELRESEDERIRKALIWHLKADADFVSNGVTKAECIAYLEKQKEQKLYWKPTKTDIALLNKAIITNNTLTPTEREELDIIRSRFGYCRATNCNGIVQKEQKHPNGCFTCDEYKKGYEEGRRNGFTAGYNKAMKEVEQKEQKPVESISQLTVKGKGVYKICPYCKSRMIRDESKIYTSIPPQYGYNCPKCGAMEFDTVIYDNPEMEAHKSDSLIYDKDLDKAAREFYLSGGAYSPFDSTGLVPIVRMAEFGATWMKKKIEEEQKPAEWDDYTKTNLGRAIQIIKDARGNLYGYQTDDGIYECDKAIEALEHFLYRGLEIEKSAEWSEEDDGELQNAIDALEFLGKKGVYKSESGYDAALQAASWLKNLSLDLKKRNEDVTKLCSNEWSEEDEEIFNNIIEKAKGGHWIEVNEITWLIAWFKSLRLQPKQE